MGEFLLGAAAIGALMTIKRAGRRPSPQQRKGRQSSRDLAPRRGDRATGVRRWRLAASVLHGDWSTALRRLAPLGLALLLPLGGCLGQQRPGAGPGSAASGLPRVVAADGVLCDLVRRLAGRDLAVTCLLGPGEDPHAFRPTPSQRQALALASLVLINGYGLSPALERISGAVALAERAVPQSPRLEAPPATSVGADPVHEHKHEHEHDHSHSGDRDPHVWHDPQQAQALVRAAAQQLAALRPERRAAISARALRLERLLDELDRWNRQQLATIPPTATGQRPTLATGHRAAASLARRYGLEELPVVDAHSSSAVLRPEALQAVLAELRRRQVRSLFAEPGPPPRALLRISRMAGVPISPEPLVLDGLARGSAGPPTLMATLVANTCAISAGLGGRCDRPAGVGLIQRWQAVGAAGVPASGEN
jgi:ABC-type Zn uptake system ZnuABC Zn-binding protein ZnuA